MQVYINMCVSVCASAFMWHLYLWKNILTATETNLRPGRKSRRSLSALVNVKPELGFHMKNNR